MRRVTHVSDRARSRITAISVSSGMLMEFIDSTALGNALPAMGRYFHLPPVELNLALSAYVLALALFIPASGWLGDRFGARRVYLIAISIFAFGSILCALSHSVPFLVVGRVVQGLGGSMMTPVARTIIVSSTPRSELVNAMSWFTTPATLALDLLDQFACCAHRRYFGVAVRAWNEKHLETAFRLARLHSERGDDDHVRGHLRTAR